MADAQNVLTLDDGYARVSVDPSRGASLGDYVLRSGLPILVPGGAGRAGAFALGSQVLLPFANRISGGGFHHQGVFHRLTPNMPGEPFPIHGNASALAWSVVSRDPASVILALESDGPAGFAYSATLTHALDAGILTSTIDVTNRASHDMPFGLGFHPWFARTPESRIRFAASGRWTETHDHLPLDFEPIEAAEMGDGRLTPLPRQFCNTAYVDWSGEVELEWPEHGLGIRMTARGADVLMIYSPGAGADFVCIEPVSHTVDAHNRSGRGVVPPRNLAPGESLGASMVITPMPIG